MNEKYNDELLPINQVGLIVHTCDRYKLLYKGFELFFRKYWPYANLKLNYYFLTEEEDYQSDLFQNIKTGKGEWSDRLLKGLKQIPENYIIYFQEDMWLNREVDEIALRGILQYVLANKVDHIKLTCNDVYRSKPTDEFINGFRIALLNNEKSKYVMSHQVAVWKKTFFENQLKFKENPWQNEKQGTKRLKKLHTLIYQIDLIQEYDYPPINKNRDDSTIAQYYTISKNAQLNDVAYSYINKMKLDSDAVIREYAQKLDHHLKNGLTHDGKEKPRKEDLIKKIKTYLSRKK